MSDEPSAPSPLATPRVLCAAIFGTQLTLAGILFVPGIVDVPQPPIPALTLAFGAAAAAALVVSFVLPRVILASAVLRATSPVQEDASRAESAGYRDTSSAPKAYVARRAALAEAVRLGFSPMILGLALSQAVSLFGFTLGFLGASPLEYAPFFVVGIGATLARFPTERRVLGPFAAARGVVL